MYLTSMAMMVYQSQSNASMPIPVLDAPQENSSNNRELAIVRVNKFETSEINYQSGVHNSQAWYGSNLHSTADRIPPPGAGVWDGPPRWASSTIGILTVQCARCMKWRVVPSREIYESIREHILETPWVCENALLWRSDAHCALPTDLSQDSRMLWAIDKPNLPSSPPGWQRKVVVRRDCSTRFADVYYTSPDGKSLRSTVEVAKYLEENPGSVPEGTKMRQFSFTTPQPLPGIWTARKRNPKRSVLSLSSSEGTVKKARAPQPLTKQLAHRLLLGNNSPSLAPPTPMPSAPSFQQPVEVPFVP